ncbi:MAG: G-protein alpha subunit IN n subclass, partial [Olpidium bornovanus]
MGCSVSQEESDRKKISNAIEKELKKNRVAQKYEVKLLLLGAGESGKSTVLKQMKLIHDNGFSDDERVAAREVIFSNIVQSMRAILEAMKSL